MDDEETLAIDLKLFKFIGFYQIVDPSSPKLFGYNVYKLVNCILIMVTTTMTVVGMSGNVFGTDGPVEYDFKYVQLLFYIGCILIGNVKLIIVICNAERIFDLFTVAHNSFLTSKHCKKNWRKIENCRRQFKRIFLFYLFFFFMTGILWTSMPVIVNNYTVSGKLQNDLSTSRKLSIVNLRFPVTVSTYNKFYSVFFSVECLLVSYCTFGLVTYDLFLIALLLLTSDHYQVVSSAYESFDFKGKHKDGKFSF